MKNIDTLNDIERRFRNLAYWTDPRTGTDDIPRSSSHEGENAFRWQFYGPAFSAMDNGRIRLRDIIAIAGVCGITESVIRMRRRDWIAMRGGK